MQYFIKKGWMLNQKENIVENISKAVIRCDGYCPCENPYKGTENAKCPCKSYLVDNKCYCGLYVKIKK